MSDGSSPFQKPGPGRLVTTVRVSSVTGVNAAPPPADAVVWVVSASSSSPHAARPATRVTDSNTAPNPRKPTWTSQVLRPKPGRASIDPSGTCGAWIADQEALPSRPPSPPAPTSGPRRRPKRRAKPRDHHGGGPGRATQPRPPQPARLLPRLTPRWPSGAVP